LQGFDRQRKEVGKVQRKQTKSVNNSADKELGKGKHGKNWSVCLFPVLDVRGRCKINWSWIFNQFNCYQLSLLFTFFNNCQKYLSRMLLNLLSILALTCSNQFSALYHVWWGEITYLLTKIHTHCKYNKLIFMYPLRHVCFIRRRTYSARHLLQGQKLYRKVQQTNYQSKSDHNFKTTATSARYNHSKAFISTYCQLILVFEFCVSHNILVNWRISTLQLQVKVLTCVRTLRVALDNLAAVKNWQQIWFDMLMFLTISPHQICYHLIKFKLQGHLPTILKFITSFSERSESQSPLYDVLKTRAS